MPTKKIQIDWKYPRDFESALQTEVSYEGFGLYFITRVFGENESALYIGMTYFQNFFQRLNEHNINWLNNYRGLKRVRFGIVVNHKAIDDKVLYDVESGLIHELQPVQNVSKIKSYTYENLYTIENTGYHGLLPKVVDMKNHTKG